MQTFRQFESNITEGRSRGEAMEDVIVSAVNGKPQGNSKFNLDAEAGVKVAKFLKQKGITGKGQVLGADTIDVTSEWSKYFDGKVPAATKTPKTDFIVGNAKISLKSGEAAQLMSGAKSETTATFYAALEKSKDEMDKKVTDKLTGMFEGLAPSSVTSGKLADVIKNQTDEVVNKANAAHKELMSELKSVFESNTKFRDEFAYEAMSGEVKFGGNNGTCTHFLVTEFDGTNSKLHSVSDSKYVSKIAKQMKVSVRFKTTSVKKKVGGKTVKTGEYRYWSAVGLIIDKMNEDIDDMMHSGELLTEGKIIDFFKGVWNRIKNFFIKAVQYAKKSVKNLFDFLEVKPIVNVNTRVKF